MNPHHAASAKEFRVSNSCLVVAVAGVLAICAPAQAAVSEADAKVGIVECTDAVLKNHNPGLADNPDRLICFEGYVSNFNTKARSGKPKFLGVPHWVSHHVRRAPSAQQESGDRPKWATVPELNAQGMAPTHESYEFSIKFKI